MQAQTLREQYAYGYSATDYLHACVPAPGGGLILGGETWDHEGMFGANASRFLVVRLDNRQQLLWQKEFGESTHSSLEAIASVKHGGFVLAGNCDSTQGSGYLVRIDESGNKLWERFFREVNLWSIEEARNGDLLLGGAIYPMGDYDYWVARTDSSGHVLWQQTFGGRSDDYLLKVKPLKNGDIIVVGGSLSGVSGNKTTPLRGSSDGWVLRLNKHGQILWQRSVGGDGDEYFDEVIPLANGSLILAGTTTSPPDVAGSDHASGQGDFWLAKMTADGRTVWERTYGGSGSENLNAAIKTRDGGYLLGGYSGSDDGNRNSPSFDLDRGDYWVLRLNRFGEPMWDATCGGDSTDVLADLIETRDGGFVLAGASASGLEGNKTTAGLGGYDFWLVNLDSDAKFDSDHDGVPDRRDKCLRTPIGSVVDSNGCSLEQLVPCDREWKNHHAYVRRFQAVAVDFYERGLLSRTEMRNAIRNAFRRDCGTSR